MILKAQGKPSFIQFLFRYLMLSEVGFKKLVSPF